MDNHFFSKIAKSISEFMILAILKEKGELHTYEIQQELISKFRRVNSHSNEMIDLIQIFLNKNGQKSPKNFTQEEQNNQYMYYEQMEDLIKLLTNGESVNQLDKQTKELFTNLGAELEIINNFIHFPVKIWDSLSSIYQVMKDLEKQGFIEITRSEIVNGRTRKIYQITKKGETEAVRMIFTFNGINSSIYPQFLNFSDVLSQFYSNHTFNLNSLFSKIIEGQSKNLKSHTQDNNIDSLHKKVNIFADNQFQILINLLSISELNETEITKILSLLDTNQDVNVLDKLKMQKTKIEHLIEKLT